MDAQKFGHSVGQFFKKIDRTLSFLPEKPRKVAVAAAALAASPVLAGVIISQTKTSNHTDYDIKDANKPIKETSFLAELLKDDASPEEDGYRDGAEGVGFYANGTRIDTEDDIDTFKYMDEFYEIK
ncbi:hypothetical protein [Rodentibacter trehalosifermentans]|uniref:hypothetical protein n=1 Tax=Rodentibacter trehalosifermentans TaxID=1908263 RepID=UPI0009846B70|nr:hypothetical protein [Rodentibacter trehalosifermentans]OOF52310.1 hypothetical protein BKK53_05945 [Rodentibacter trehalosifermentans]